MPRTTAKTPPSPAPRPARVRPGRPSAGSPVGEELRELIIAAAARVYAINGYRATTVDAIAREAGVSRPLFYRHFKDRREIIAIVAGRAHDELGRRIIASIRPGTDRIAITEDTVDAYLGWCEACGPLVGPLYKELQDPESPAGEEFERVIKQFIDYFRALSQAAGRPPLDPIMYDALIRTLHMIGSKAYSPAKALPAEIARRKRIILRMLIAAVSTPDTQERVPPLSTVTDPRP